MDTHNYKGIQYDLETGKITGCCTPAIDTDKQPMPEGRGQYLVDPSMEYDGLKVDINAALPTLVPDVD